MTINTISSSAPIVTKSSTTSNSPDIVTPTPPSTSDNTISTKWGFKVDENGFFGIDFNETVGIPDDIKVHQSMMDMADKYTSVRNNGMDSLSLFSKTWALFSTIAGDTLDPSGTGYMTQEETAAMPKSYVSKGTLTDGIVSVQKNMNQYIETSRFAAEVDNLSDGMLSIGFRGFMAYDGVSSRDGDGSTAFYGSREVFEYYSGANYEENQVDDKLAVGELFGAFFYKRVDEEISAFESYNSGQNARGYMQNGSIQGTKNYYQFLESGMDIKTYIENAKGKEYLDDFSNRISRLPNGTVDTDLADKFFEELERSIQEQRKIYQEATYASLESSIKDNTNSTLSSAYQNVKSTKLPSSGSLISIGA